VWRVTHGRDVIPHLPPAWIGYVHAPREAFYCTGWQCPLAEAPPRALSRRRLLRLAGPPTSPLQAPESSLLPHASAGGGERVVECSPTNGEDPRCADGLWLTASISDHLVYMGMRISRLCARE
jgi:hypothetical protein